MSGSPQFQIKPTANFERSLKDLLRRRYKRNPGGQQALLALLGRCLVALANEGRLPRARLEKWPHRALVPSWELWKHHFQMPGLSGSASEGRLMYLINKMTATILPIWIYTHAEFEGRPVDEGLAAAISEAVTPAPAQKAD